MRMVLVQASMVSMGPLALLQRMSIESHTAIPNKIVTVGVTLGIGVGAGVPLLTTNTKSRRCCILICCPRLVFSWRAFRWAFSWTACHNCCCAYLLLCFFFSSCKAIMLLVACEFQAPPAFVLEATYLLVE